MTQFDRQPDDPPPPERPRSLVRRVLSEGINSVLRIFEFLLGIVCAVFAFLIVGVAATIVGWRPDMIAFLLDVGGVIALMVFVVRKREKLPGAARAFLIGFLLTDCFLLLMAGICSLGGPLKFD
jgi:hypothetical protein